MGDVGLFGVMRPILIAVSGRISIGLGIGSVVVLRCGEIGNQSILSLHKLEPLDACYMAMPH